MRTHAESGRLGSIRRRLARELDRFRPCRSFPEPGSEAHDHFQAAARPTPWNIRHPDHLIDALFGLPDGGEPAPHYRSTCRPGHQANSSFTWPTPPPPSTGRTCTRGILTPDEFPNRIEEQRLITAPVDSDGSLTRVIGVQRIHACRVRRAPVNGREHRVSPGGALHGAGHGLTIFPGRRAPYPSGKGEACKAFIRRFESGRRLVVDTRLFQSF